jgi:peptide/nickel transport system substrate-binding protein
MDRASKLADLLRNAAPTTRREFLKRSAIMGVSIPVAGSLLAACGDDDDDADDEPTMAPADPTATEAAAAPEPTDEPDDEDDDDDDADDEPTMAPADPTATEEAAAPEPTDEPDDEDDDDGRQGGTIVLMGHHQIASLSPDDAGPTVHWVAVTNIHNAMLELDSWYVLQPTLAESFDVSDDGLEYVFNLRSGVLFHDGEEFTADDVAYTFNFYGDDANSMITASNFNGVASVEATDDSTVTVTLDAPNAAFLTRAGQAFIVPEHYHSDVGEDEYKGAPVGTGPYMLSEWRAAEYTELVAFDDHFRGRPHIDVLRENIVPEASVRAIALETGEADSSIWSLVTEDNLRFADAGTFTTYITSSTAVNHFPINHNRPQFAEKEVRQAMMHALNRDEIVDDLWRGAAVKATANLSPALAFYYEPDVKQYEYDPELAMQMLDDAGWVPGGDGIREKDGVRLEWTCAVITGDQARMPVAVLAQEYFAAVGMQMNIVEEPSTSAGMREDRLDMAHYNWTYGGASGEPDPSNTLRSDSLNNFSHYVSAEMDELIDRGLSETDPEARREIYSEVQKLVAEDVPFLYIKFWDWYTFFTPRVQGLPDEILAGTQIYNMIYQMWLEE